MSVNPRSGGLRSFNAACMNCTMLRVLKYLIVLAIFSLLAGCAKDDPDDINFFNNGWRHPEQGADDRMNDTVHY